MDLMCWVDIEQFRRMLHKDKEGREEKSKDIKNKYLNKKYFFGPNSPATRQQQEQVPVTKAFIKKLWLRWVCHQLYSYFSPSYLCNCNLHFLASTSGTEPVWFCFGCRGPLLPVQGHPSRSSQNISLKSWSEATARACRAQLRKSVKMFFRQSGLFQLSIFGMSVKSQTASLSCGTQIHLDTYEIYLVKLGYYLPESVFYYR